MEIVVKIKLLVTVTNVEQKTSGKKTQCKFMKKISKKKKERCKMQTANKSGLCYYHD